MILSTIFFAKKRNPGLRDPHLLFRKGKQCYAPCPLYRLSQFSLMLCAVTCHPPGKNLPSFGKIAFEDLDILVIYVLYLF